MAFLLSFWVAGRAGRLQRRVRFLGKPPSVQDIDLCDRLARGEQMRAGDLWVAEGIAVQVWSAVGFWVLGLMAVSGFFALVFHVGRTAPGVLDVVGPTGAFLLGNSFSQMSLIAWRGSSLKRLSARSDPSVLDRVVTRGVALPRWWDFWLITVVTIGITYVAMKGTAPS